MMIPYSRLRLAVPLFVLLVGLGYFINWQYLSASALKHVKVFHNFNTSSLWRPGHYPFKEESPLESWLILPSLPAVFDCGDLTSKYQGWKLLILDVDASKNSGCPRNFLIELSDDSSTSTKSWLLVDALLFAIQKGANMIYVAPAPDPVSIRHGALRIPRLDNLHYAKPYQAENASQPHLLNYKLCGLDTHFDHLQEQFYTDPSLVIPLFCCEDENVLMVENGSLLTDLIVTTGLFRTSMFWALPMLWIDGEEQQMAWSLLVQRILALKGDGMLIATQSHDAMPNYCYKVNSSRSISLSPKFIQHVSQFRWRNNSKLLYNIEEIVEYSEKYVAIKQNPFLDWIFKLKKLGWEETSIPSDNRSVHGHVDVTVDTNISHLSTATMDSMPYNIYTNQGRNCSLQQLENCEVSQKLYQQTCREMTHLPEKPCPQRINDILLVIAFNKPHFEALPYLELLYRPWFPNILFCGPSTPDIDFHPELSNYTYSFMSFGGTPEGHPPGSFNYECLVLAAGVRAEVDGYLLIGDDILLNTSRISDLDHQQLWFLPKEDVYISRVSNMSHCFMGACGNGRQLMDRSYESEMRALLKDLHANPTASPVLHHCHQALQALGNQTFYSSYGDIVYIPKGLMANFSQLAKLFRANHVFLEAALASIVHCLEPPSKILNLSGLAIWDKSRNEPWRHVQKMQQRKLAFLHPTKWGSLVKNNTELVKFYCSNVQSHPCRVL